mmetsp:Transcript_29494/g.38779  ORF Transcript_29494/g.38779 Transcript_29494/m.38779 type:complete len:81 (+) Transcript_29494:693-935(+)
MVKEKYVQQLVKTPQLQQRKDPKQVEMSGFQTNGGVAEEEQDGEEGEEEGVVFRSKLALKYSGKYTTMHSATIHIPYYSR